uniref:Predicted protein n=1 Tax=Hordeum vulgare subsp. vulgare TaxID=112509 RepID=F2DT95_HORVV|nr:predicted protein [Hordeum vulgare subsp. vulgare]
MDTACGGEPPQPKAVCVIGAGMAGLAAARELRREGHDVTVLEQSGDVGGQWLYDPRTDGADPLGAAAPVKVHSGVYASLRLISPRQSTGFSDFPFCPKTGRDNRRFPGHREVHLYLKDFCAAVRARVPAVAGAVALLRRRAEEDLRAPVLRDAGPMGGAGAVRQAGAAGGGGDAPVRGGVLPRQGGRRRAPQVHPRDRRAGPHVHGRFRGEVLRLPPSRGVEAGAADLVRARHDRGLGDLPRRTPGQRLHSRGYAGVAALLSAHQASYNYQLLLACCYTGGDGRPCQAALHQQAE